MNKLDEVAMTLIERRQQKIQDMGHRPVDPLPAQLRHPVLYANALLTQLTMLKSEMSTQELHIVPDDLDTGSLDFTL